VIELGANRYGKSAVRLVKVVRGPDHHEIRDLTVAISLEGDFEAAHVEGDNSLVILTDTMKNTVYALAGKHLTGAVEGFGVALADHFLAYPQVSSATVSIDQHDWRPVPTPAGPAPHAFVRSGELTRTAVVTATAGGVSVTAGLRDLVVMKTAGSSFSGFPRDRFTTLAETDDRIMATKVTATWPYGVADLDYDASFAAVRATLLEVFAEHHSPSVQTSIWIMGQAVLERHPEVAEIRMVLPNLHHWAADLSPFGMGNDNEIFVATTEPHGLIDATVRRS
jgi:urate oxidase